MNKQVSVIIPFYNAEKFIAETIQSVLEQSYINYELILVNDGSTDDSEKICWSFSDKRINYLKIPNGGVSMARNIGYAKSSGEYVAFLDADDRWLTERLQKTVDKMNDDSSIGLIHTHIAVIDENGKKTGQVFHGKEGWILDDLLKWEECCIPAPSSILVRREVLKNVGLFDKNLSTAADHDFFFRVSSKYKIAMLPEVLGEYRVHENNMHLNIKRMEKDHVYTYRKADKNGFFSNKKFKKHCFGNLYRILSGSYWVNARDIFNAIRCGLISLYYYPSMTAFLKIRK